jgi:hypothetical protein
VPSGDDVAMPQDQRGLFGRSSIVMLLADDARRYVDVNAAACVIPVG